MIFDQIKLVLSAVGPH